MSAVILVSRHGYPTALSNLNSCENRYLNKSRLIKMSPAFQSFGVGMYVICMNQLEINNAFEIIILLYWVKVKNKAFLPQLLSPFISLVRLRAIRSYLEVSIKSAVLQVRKRDRLSEFRVLMLISNLKSTITSLLNAGSPQNHACP